MEIGDFEEMYAMQTHLNHQYYKDVCGYEHFNKHSLCSTPNPISCPVVNAVLCLPLCCGLKKPKSPQQSDWILATFFLSEKRGIDLLSSRRLKDTHPDLADHIGNLAAILQREASAV